LTDTRLKNLKTSWAPLHERTYQELKTAIMSGRFMPGEKLTVRGLSEELGVSAMPARAAILRLAAEKALDLSGTSGSASIPLLTKSRFNEMYELRVLLEGRATERAARQMTKKDFSELQQLLVELETASVRGNSDKYLEVNQRFKFKIFQSADQPVLEDLIERLWMQIGPFMRFYGKGIMDLRVDRHKTALSALIARDGVTARSALEADVKEGATFLLTNAEFAEEA
jgi:DNA-binding GntR family transcriptional regulator